MFVVDSCDKRILKAAEHVMVLFEDKRFWRQVALQRYDMSDIEAAQLAVIMVNWVKLEEITITTYRPWYWRSKARARFQPSKPDTVQLSSRRLNRYADEHENHASIGGSIVHEIVHLVDDKFEEFSFGHKGNTSNGKENTAPNKIGRMAKQWISNHYGEAA